VLLLSVSFLILSVYFFWRSFLQRKRSGLPGGRIIYADTSKWGRLEKSLYVPELGLAGKPDYLVEIGDELIPVEVKSTIVRHAPYDSHIYQLAAYCLMVHKIHKRRPSYGILHYPNRTFSVDFTNELEVEVLAILDQMRSISRKKNVTRSHDSPARCSGCGFRKVCDQSLS
jgi:CRISPR-associated exonuclease Cas4